MLKNFPLLQALADREDSVRNGKLMVSVNNPGILLLINKLVYRILTR